MWKWQEVQAVLPEKRGRVTHGQSPHTSTQMASVRCQIDPRADGRGLKYLYLEVLSSDRLGRLKESLPGCYVGVLNVVE